MPDNHSKVLSDSSIMGHWVTCAKPNIFTVEKDMQAAGPPLRTRADCYYNPALKSQQYMPFPWLVDGSKILPGLIMHDKKGSLLLHLTDGFNIPGQDWWVPMPQSTKSRIARIVSCLLYACTRVHTFFDQQNGLELSKFLEVCGRDVAIMVHDQW